MKGYVYWPVTPGGSYLSHLESRTEEKAIRKLLKEAEHMPYRTWENFKERGYRIARIPVR